MNFPAMNTPDPVDLGHGVTTQWLYTGAIISFHLKRMERVAVDTWAESIYQAVDMIPVEKPALLLHELPEMPLTPYFRQRGGEIVQHYRDKRQGRTAVLLPVTIFKTLMQNFMERDLNKFSQSFERRLFSDKTQALQWLLEAVAQE